MIRKALLAALVCSVAVGSAFANPSKDNIAACKKFYKEVVNGGNIALIDELCAENFIEHEVFPGLTQDREGVKKFFTMMRTAFPDFKMDVEFMMTDGDKVACYITMTGTHKGEFMGMPATGKAFSVKTIDIMRFENGKAVEHWGVTDGMTMMEQLGALPGHEKKTKGGAH